MGNEEKLIEAAKEHLIHWLEYPAELGSKPDKIEFLKKITIDFDGQNNFLHYFVFRFMTNEPHWAAKNNWMLGVVGPYFDDSKIEYWPHSTFSRLSEEKKISPEEETKWVHENISLRKT